MKDLGVDPARFETAFERKLYPSLGLSRGVFFPREAFGRDALVTGDPQAIMADDLGPGLLNARGIRAIRRGFSGLGGEQSAAHRALRGDARSAAGQERRAKRPRLLEKTSYRDYLTKVCGCTDGSRQMLLRPHARFHRLVRRAGAGVVCARNGLSRASRRSACRRTTIPNAPSPIFIISRTAMPRSRACWCARSFPASRTGKTMDDIVLARFRL